VISLVEFIHPLRKSGMRDNCLAVLYYQEKFRDVASATVDSLRATLRSAHIKNAARANIADTLAKSAPFVETVGEDTGKFLWALTDSGKAYVRKLLKLPMVPPQVEQDVSELEALLKNITDPDVHSYVDEALKCLRVGALRATVVFLWAAAIRRVQEKCLALGVGVLNPALQKHDPKARNVSKLDDFAHVKEKTVILATEDLGLYDKSQRSVLEDCLDLRNRCGHPSKYAPGSKKVAAFLEDVLNLAFK